MYFVRNHFNIRKYFIYVLCAHIYLTKFAAGDTCWSSNTCDIHATYYANTKADIEISKILHCDSSDWDENVNDEAAVTATSTFNALISSKNVSLNGCNAPLNAPTYGIEYLTNCEQLFSIVIERFQTDVLLPLNCTISAEQRQIQLKYLKYQYNDVRLINGESFANLDELEQLYIISNTLQYIEPHAFDNLTSLQLFHMENEPNYYLKSKSLFRQTNVEHLKFFTLKGINAEFFQNMPESLKSLHVSNTPIEQQNVSLVNALQLQHVRVNNCSITSFVLEDSYGTVLHVNLSGNAIQDLELKFGNMAVEILDLSHNQLSALPNTWTFSLPKLKQLLLHNNNLKVLSLANLLTLTTTKSALIDLSENNLSRIEDVTTLSDYYELRLKIDRNPWHCKWLIEFTDNHPNLLHLFQYDKYISRINVNGLECIADEHQPAETTIIITEPAAESLNQEANQSIPHNSHYVIGGPWEVKRNQRAEALIIVFMLPLGISFLFLLLYLWIHCHKIFSLSYYQSMPKHDHNTADDPSAATNQLTGDVTTPTDGYEVPLNIEMPKYHAIEKNRIQQGVYEVPTNDIGKKIYEEIYEIQRTKSTAGDTQVLYEQVPNN